MPISKWVDQNTMVHLQNGILRSREKEGAPTLWDSMDGTGKQYAMWNKPGGEGKIPYDLTFNGNIINIRKSKQNITRDIEVKNNLAIASGEWGKDGVEKGFQELL